MKRSCRAMLLCSDSKDGVNESHLSRELSFGDLIDLSLANHFDSFISPQGPLSTLEVSKVLPNFPPFI